MLRRLAATVPGLKATTQPASWRREGAQLLLAEAFVTADGKPEPLPAGQHAADAAAAGLALVELLDKPETLASAVCCSPHESFNLVVAMALWAALFIDPGELRSEVLVITASPSSSRKAPLSRALEPAHALGCRLSCVSAANAALSVSGAASAQAASARWRRLRLS